MNLKLIGDNYYSLKILQKGIQLSLIGKNNKLFNLLSAFYQNKLKTITINLNRER